MRKSMVKDVLWQAVAIAGTVGTLVAPVDAVSARLATDIVPVFQRIDLRVDADARDYTGEVMVELEAQQPVDSFRLHCEGPTVVDLRLTRLGRTLPVRYEHPDSVHLSVYPEGTLEPGAYTLSISFTNLFDTQAVSLYRMETEGHGYLFTQMEEDDAREAFPCWDEPVFKIPYQVVLTVPEAHMAVSNEPIESEQTEDGWRRVVFQRSQPMPSYLLAIATGPFDAVEIPGLSIPARVITVKGKGHLAEEAVRSTPPILRALERYFDSPYPFAKLDLIAVPEFWPGAMENPGAITYAEGLLLPDPRSLSVSQKRRLASVTAHELAHMWFGDVVTMEWWDDLWLNESFATWMGGKIVEEVFPQYGSDVARVQSMQGVLTGDARPSAKAVRQPISEVSDLLGNIGVVYQKGQAVLDMFEQWMGEEAFRRGVLAYIEEHAWGNATADDLWRALGEASGRDVANAMRTFIEQPGAPLVTVEPHKDGSVTLRQSRLSNYGVEPPASEPWHIPLTLSFPDAGSLKRISVELTQPEARIELGTDGPPAWILPHADGRGYYRWLVPPDMLVSLAAHAPGVLSPRERVAFVGNLAALLDAGAVGGGDFLKVLHAFSSDTHPQVIAEVVDGLAKVKNAFVTDSLQPEFARYLRATLRPALDRYGLEPQSGEDELVATIRPRLIGWLADEGDDLEVRAFAEDQFARYLQDPTSVDPALISTAVSIACLNGDRERFELCRERFETAETPADRRRFLGALGAFRAPDLQEEALQYALSGPIRPQEVFSIPGGIAGISDAHADRVFQWLMDNYETIAARVPPITRGYLVFFAGGCSESRLERARAFFAQPEHQGPGLETRMARLADQVGDCVSLRQREGAEVAAYLQAYAEPVSE